MRKSLVFCLVAMCSVVVLSQSTWAKWDPNRKQKQKDMVQETITRFKQADSTIQAFFYKAYGYVVFPSIGKGGFIVGGGRGHGHVYKKGGFIGYATMTQVTVGAQVGGQSYSEIIFFKDKAALDHFKEGNLQFSAQASAVAATEGASKDTSYDNGVAVFTMPRGGLMAEASIGGQNFKFTPK